MRNNAIFILVILAVAFLMFSTVTAVPITNKKITEEHNIFNLVKEKIKELNDDPNEVQPKCGILWALFWIWFWVKNGWVPPWPF